jgi:hypothetical protein
VIAPGGRLDIRVNDHVELPEVALLVTATEPVVVERRLARDDEVGMSHAMGVPMRDGLHVPATIEG